jgi:hypothetical protein
LCASAIGEFEDNIEVRCRHEDPALELALIEHVVEAINKAAQPDPCAALVDALREIEGMTAPTGMADDARDRCTQYAYLVLQFGKLARVALAAYEGKQA